jgi:hypothetical protein
MVMSGSAAATFALGVGSLAFFGDEWIVKIRLTFHYAAFCEEPGRLRLEIL